MPIPSLKTLPKNMEIGGIFLAVCNQLDTATVVHSLSLFSQIYPIKKLEVRLWLIKKLKRNVCRRQE